ncbi:MAG: hypothetical protein J6K55_12565 [Clostridia bacterium]|nr:hypothetical protein [Clostridia bacterium]
MAFVGMKYVVAAKLESETPGQPPVYGKGFRVGKAIEATVSYTRASNVLRADDADAEADNSITGGTLNMKVDDILDSVTTDLLGNTVNEDMEYDEVGDSAPYVGIGYLRARRHKNVTSYVTYWIWKTMLGIESETATTKQETTQWQTPSMTGSMLAVQPDATMRNKFRRRKTFEGENAEAEATAWLNRMANITETA